MMGASRPDQGGQHSSWRPPGWRRDKGGEGFLAYLVLIQLLVSCCHNVRGDSKDDGISPKSAENKPSQEELSVISDQRQGRNLGGEEAPSESRPLIKKPGAGLTVRWVRTTTSRPRFPRQSPHVPQTTKLESEHFIQPAYLLPFGQRLTKDSPLPIQKASTQDVIKPSNIRKRNFSASLVHVVSDEDILEGGAGGDKTNDIGVPTGKNDPRDENDKKPNEETKIERVRGAAARDISKIRKYDNQEIRKYENQEIRNLERSRYSIRRPSTYDPSIKSVLGPRGKPNPRINETPVQPRGRIRLHRSKIGIYQGSTTRSPRIDDDGPQRPSKRDRIRNLMIRRQSNTNVNSTQDSTPVSTSEQPRPTTVVTTVSTTTTEATTTTSITTTTQPSTQMTLSGRLEYQSIVRTTTKQTESNNLITESSVSPPPTTTTVVSSTEKVTTTATPTTVSTTTTAAPTTQKKTTKKMESTSLSDASFSTTVTSTLSSQTSTTSVSLSDDSAQNKPSDNETKNKADSTTRTPVELPGRPREELKQDLLEAIRRKISRNKVTSLGGQKTGTGFEISSERSDQSRVELPKTSSLRAERLELSNSVSSTKPPFFRPISFPPRKYEDRGIPKVRIYVNIPEDKPGSVVKIPNVSHIQDKLARLNAAITEGLKHDREEKEREEAIRADWQKDDDKQEEEMVFAAKEAISESVKRKPYSDEKVLEQEYSALGSAPHNVTVPSPSTTARLFTNVPTTAATTLRTTTTSTTTTTTTTTSTTTTTEAKIVRILSKKPRERKRKKPLYEHPSSHFRPNNSTDDFIPMPKSNLPPKEDIFIVTPKYGMYTPIAERKNVTNGTDSGSLESGNPGTGKNLGKDSKVLEDITGTTVYVVGVIAIIPAVGLLAWFVRLAIRRKALSSESSSETGLHRPIAEDDALQVTGRTGFSVASHSFDTIQEAPENIPKADPQDMLGSVWEFPRSRLRLQTVLGEGNFGKVWKAEVDDICGYEGTILVAVKGVKENASQREKDDLVQEMKIMQEIGPHPNVVTILGVCTQQEPFLLIMEYVMYGKLLTHLREQRIRQSSFFNFSKDGADVGETLTSKDLNKFAYGVAKGMEFLVCKGVIHRDLAARNILVDHNKNTKISDFGLSRNLRDIGGEMYEQKTKGALPIRWMAPESLYFSVFTPKSDVWSFGILMWEIVTLGSTPYPGMGAREVMRRVRDGYRLERPAHCHPDLYLIIQKCWAGDMNKRPDFSELRKEIAKLLEDQHGYIDLQNIPENKY